MDSRYSRRTVFRMAAGAGLAVAGAVPGGLVLNRAMAQAGDTELVCNSNGVRIRNRASLSGTVVGTLNAGDVVNLTGEPIEADGYVWLPITARQGAAGFAAADFFDTSQGGWSVGTHVVVTTDSLNLRREAGLGGAVIRSAPRGTHAITRWAPIERDGYTWYGVVLDDGTEGFFAGEFLEEGTGGGTGDGWAAGTPLIVADGPLNLRQSAGTGGGVIRTYATGTQATVISGPTAANGYDWYKVEVEDGNVGWFAGEFLAVARTEPTGERLRVVNGPLRLRASPGLGGAVVRTLANGTIVVVADASFVRQDGYLWKQVRLEADASVEGYIADGFTEAIG